MHREQSCILCINAKIQLCSGGISYNNHLIIISNVDYSFNYENMDNNRALNARTDIITISMILFYDIMSFRSFYFDFIIY